MALWRWIRAKVSLMWRRVRVKVTRQYVPLSVHVDGKVIDVIAVAAVGMHLSVRLPTGGYRLVSERQCRSAVEFWDAWYTLNDSRLTWEDGTPYERPR